MLPLRYNPIRVVIRKILRSDTYVDPDFGNPVGGEAGIMYSDPIELEGQVNFGKKVFQKFLNTQAGDSNNSAGHIVFLKRKLDELGVKIDKGDKIVEIGPSGSAQIVDFVIDEVRPESPWRGDFLLFYAQFKDNRDTNSRVSR